MDAPPLHDRTFPRTLPHKCGWRRVAIGMGLAHHCLYLNLHFYIISEIRQYPKVVANLRFADDSEVDVDKPVYQDV
jgi:hypothetical protein